MKEIKGNKSINQEEICNNITCNDCVSIVFKNISKKEQHKKIAREFLFYMYDHPKINEFCKRFKLHKNSIFFYQPLSKNRILDKDGHIAYIDLSKIEPNENKDFVDTYNFISDSELINNLDEIFSNLKKILLLTQNLLLSHPYGIKEI
jgi:hypothetical protein